MTSATSNPFTITAGPAAIIQSSGGTPQSTVINTAFTVPLQSLVTDSVGNPVSGVTVTFTVPATGATASLSSRTVTTDSSGHASVNATANGVAGAYSVTAGAGGVSAAASFALANVAAGVAHLTFVQQPQGTTAGATINAVTVKATDSGNNPVRGIVIGMSATLGSGTLEGTLTATTDASGTATFADLVIRKSGAYRLRAATGLISELSQPFPIMAAAVANITVFGGDGQSATVGTAYGTLLRATVTDEFGNPVKNVPVTFTAPASGAGVTFAGSTTVTTGEQGIATAPVATANQSAGLFQVTAMTARSPASFGNLQSHQPGGERPTHACAFVLATCRYNRGAGDHAGGHRTSCRTASATRWRWKVWRRPAGESGLLGVPTPAREPRAPSRMRSRELAAFPNVIINQASSLHADRGIG